MEEKEYEEFLNEHVMEKCKEDLKFHIETLVKRGVRKANIEIELLFYIKELLKNE